MDGYITGAGDYIKSLAPNTNKNKENIIFSSKDGTVIRKDNGVGGGLYDSRNKFDKDSKC